MRLSSIIVGASFVAADSLSAPPIAGIHTNKPALGMDSVSASLTVTRYSDRSQPFEVVAPTPRQGNENDRAAKKPLSTKAKSNRFYHALMGIYHRKRPYDPVVWHEPDPRTLLFKVMPKTGRSGIALMMLFPEKHAIVSMYAYCVFRVQDTWADVCLGPENRIAGLKGFPSRLRSLMKGERPPIDVFAEQVKWASDSPKQIMNVDIVKNVHRFDDVFISLTPQNQELVAKYAENMRDGLIDLELRQGVPPSRAFTRRVSEVANGFGVVGLMQACGLYLLAEEIQARPPSKVAVSMLDFCEFINYPQLASTIEEDVMEGIFHHVELLQMNKMDPEVLSRVKAHWVRLGLDLAPLLPDFLLHTDFKQSLTMRIFLLGFLRFSVEVNKRLVAEEIGAPLKKSSAWKILFGTVAKSYLFSFYKKAIKKELKKAQGLRKLLADFDEPSQVSGRSLEAGQ